MLVRVAFMVITKNYHFQKIVILINPDKFMQLQKIK